MTNSKLAANGALASLRTEVQRRTWSKRAQNWDHSSMPGLEKIANRVLEEAGDLSGLVVVDLGCGSGQLSLKLACTAKKVLAVDFSSAMLERLAERAAQAGLDNVETVAAALQRLELPPSSADVVVSNYALHHLRRNEKQQLLCRCRKWLVPGGRIVIGDMMFALVGDPEGRSIAASKVVSIARRGPAGWWRVAKNAWKVLVARQECPESMVTWEQMLVAAGFRVSRSERVVAEAAMVSACVPYVGEGGEVRP